jgi:hypothetical protein
MDDEFEQLMARLGAERAERKAAYRKKGPPMQPVHLDPIDVPCPLCRVKPGQRCKAVSNPHEDRVEWASELMSRANQPGEQGNGYRSRIKRGEIPNRPTPCGTETAYVRHIRNGEPVDEACLIAARSAQAERARQYRARKKAATAATNNKG